MNDRQAVKQGINQLFKEPKQDNYIDYSSVPVYRVIANTNVTGWFLVINEDQLKNLGVDLSNVTVAKLNTWKNNHMDNANHLQWARGDSWEAVAEAEGIEPVPSEGPTP